MTRNKNTFKKKDTDHLYVHKDLGKMIDKLKETLTTQTKKPVTRVKASQEASKIIKRWLGE